jgi:nucleoside-diphosphate-sugar epimerase
MMVNATSIPQCVLVTGANGFVGSHVIDALLKAGYFVKAVVRNTWSNIPQGVELIVADISSPVDWSNALRDVTTIIHLAARVHQMNESPQMALEEYRNINTGATLELAEQAAKAGVKRFIYLSTVAVNGAFTEPGEYFTEQSESKPKSSYAISKYESELGLQKLALQYPIEVTMIRPPMVYGKNAPGNFSRLVSLVKAGIPLPFRLAKNPRSFIFIENLASFILVCVEHSAAGNELFLVSDDDDISLCVLICQISKNLKLRPRVFSLPVRLLEAVLIVLGQRALVNQLLKPMRINISKARDLLGWEPHYSSFFGLNNSVKK